MELDIAANKIGIAIAVFNAEGILEDCLRQLYGAEYTFVVFDDGSADGTARLLRERFPRVIVLTGDGNQWWAGGTRRAVERCLAEGCDYIVLLNPDVRMGPPQVEALVDYARRHPNAIVAPLVVEDSDDTKIAWAGSRFGKVYPLVPIYVSRYIAKRGAPVGAVGEAPYPSDEAHGRGVVLSRAIIDRIGMFDDRAFPHYGADVDYSLRAREAGLEIAILPAVRVRLKTENTGMINRRGQSFAARLKTIRDYLLERKNGEALRLWWRLYRRHVPALAFPTSYLAVVAWNIWVRLWR